MASIIEDIVKLQQQRSLGEYAHGGDAAPGTVSELEEALGAAEKSEMLDEESRFFGPGGENSYALEVIRGMQMADKRIKTKGQEYTGQHDGLGMARGGGVVFHVGKVDGRVGALERVDNVVIVSILTNGRYPASLSFKVKTPVKKVAKSSLPKKIVAKLKANKAFVVWDENGNVVQESLAEDRHLTEVMIIRQDDKKVIDAFVNKKSAKSNYLKSTGKALHGLWTGGKGIAKWSGSKIAFSDKGDESFDVVQNAIKKVAPKKVAESMATAYTLVDQLTEAYIGTVYKDGKDMYVDTAFLNSVGSGAPGFHIDHMGFGEFVIMGPKGERIEVDRMRGKDFPGQSGRSHKLYPGSGADKRIVSKLVNQMIKKGKAKIQKKLKVPSPKAMAKKTGMRLSGKPVGKAQKAILRGYQMTADENPGKKYWVTLAQTPGVLGRGISSEKWEKAADILVTKGLLDKQGDKYRLAEDKTTEAEDVAALTEALQADVDVEFPRPPAKDEPEEQQEDLDIGDEAARILTAISEADGATLSAPAIAETAGLEKRVVRHELAMMEQARLVSRTHPAADDWRVTHFGEACAKGKKKGKEHLTRQEAEKFGMKMPKPKGGKWKGPKKEKLGERMRDMDLAQAGKSDQGFTDDEENRVRMMGIKDLINLERRLLDAYNKKRSKGNKLRLVSVQNRLARMDTRGKGRKGGGSRGHYSMFEDSLTDEERFVEALSDDTIEALEEGAIGADHLQEMIDVFTEDLEIEEDDARELAREVISEALKKKLTMREKRIAKMKAAGKIKASDDESSMERRLKREAAKGDKDAAQRVSLLKRKGNKKKKETLKSKRAKLKAKIKGMSRHERAQLKKKRAQGRAEKSGKLKPGQKMVFGKVVNVKKMKRKMREGLEEAQGKININIHGAFEPLAIRKAEQNAIEAFLNQEKGYSRQLESTGKELLGLWGGGGVIARWLKGGQIEFLDYGIGGAPIDAVQKIVKKMVKGIHFKRTKAKIGESKEGSYKAQGPLEKMVGEMVRGQSGKWLSKDQMKAIVRVLNKKGIKEPSKDSYDDIARIVGKTLKGLMKSESLNEEHLLEGMREGVKYYLDLNGFTGWKFVAGGKGKTKGVLVIKFDDASDARKAANVMSRVRIFRGKWSAKGNLLKWHVPAEKEKSLSGYSAPQKKPERYSPLSRAAYAMTVGGEMK